MSKQFNWRTLPENVYEEVVRSFPSLKSKINKNRMLEWLIVDAFLHGKDVIQLAQRFVLSTSNYDTYSAEDCINKAKEDLDGLFELKNLADDFSEYIATGFLPELEGEAYMDYNPFKGKSRVGVYVTNSKFEEIKHMFSQEPSEDRVFLETGKKVTPDSKKTMKKKAQEYAEKQVQRYETIDNLPNMVDYCALVNEMANNKKRAQLINANYADALDYLKNRYRYQLSPCESETKYLLNRSQIERVKDNSYNIYSLVKPNSPRIFDILDQNLKREVRARLFGGCSDIDLSRSQLVIIASLALQTELAEQASDLMSWVTVPKLWNALVEDTGYEKSILKHCVYTLCFGGNEFTWVNENYIQTKEEAGILIKHPFFALVKRLANHLRNDIKKKGYVEIDNCLFEVDDDKFKPRNALARKIQYIESMIIYAVLRKINEVSKVTLIGAYHDGLLVYISDKMRSKGLLETLNKIAQDKALEWSISNVSLEIKE